MQRLQFRPSAPSSEGADFRANLRLSAGADRPGAATERAAAAAEVHVVGRHNRTLIDFGPAGPQWFRTKIFG